MRRFWKSMPCSWDSMRRFKEVCAIMEKYAAMGELMRSFNELYRVRFLGIAGFC